MDSCRDNQNVVRTASCVLAHITKMSETLASSPSSINITKISETLRTHETPPHTKRRGHERTPTYTNMMNTSFSIRLRALRQQNDPRKKTRLLENDVFLTSLYTNKRSGLLYLLIFFCDDLTGRLVRFHQNASSNWRRRHLRIIR